MTVDLEPRSPAETYTRFRAWTNTETPYRSSDQFQMQVAAHRTCNASMFRSDQIVVTTGNDSRSTEPLLEEQSLVATPQNQTVEFNALSKVDLSARLGKVLPFFAPSPQGQALDLSRVSKWLEFAEVIPGRIKLVIPDQNDRRYESFRIKFVSLLLDDPLEDGITHPAEQVIEESLSYDVSETCDWLSTALVDYYDTRPSIGAAILRCIGRLEFAQVGDWGMRVADDALQHHDIEVREAAIRALEAWGGTEAVEMLSNHSDSEDWLNDYTQQVILDLSRNDL